MLSVERNKKGDFVLNMPGPALVYLQEVPARLSRVLTEPESSGKAYKRLFPAAYKDDAHEAEYRKLMDEEIRHQKLENVDEFDTLLKESEIDFTVSEVIVPAHRFEAWLGFVNDMRLVLGTELGIEEDYWDDEVPEDHPQAESFFLLHFLSAIQELLVRASGVELDLHPDDLSDDSEGQ